MINSFPPIANSETHILIIGSMPSIASLEATEYYAHPKNHFWRLINDFFHEGKEWSSYEEKKNCLSEHHIGLWDALKKCERKGSLDSAICQAVPNDFKTFFKKYPSVQILLFNGISAFKFFKKYHLDLLKEKRFKYIPREYFSQELKEVGEYV